jgi:uncharacterized protein
VTGTDRARVIEPYWIPLSDGTQLAARVWLPATGSGDSHDSHEVSNVAAGAVIEYLPYRLRDITRDHDDETGARLSSAGHVFIRVDVRGTGESGGVIHDEFEESQTDDLIEVIEHVAAQPWCNGRVGVRGYSWGGNVALYAAARGPEQLKAVVACCACGNRFERDLHWHGGALGLTNIHWAAHLNTVMGMPPDPSVVGDDWRSMWQERLAAIGTTGATWTRHQRADAYWAASSPGRRYGEVDCPVYIVGGQLDSWVDEAEHVLTTLRGPRKGMIGPWGHSFPHHGVPGPRIDWLAEEIRWWDHWLASKDTGLLDEPPLQVFVQECSAVQERTAKDVSGQWINMDTLPSEEVESRLLHLGDRTLAAVTGQPIRHRIPNAEVVGLEWREWGSTDRGAADLHGDQAGDDARSLTFDSAPLAEDLILVGRPRLTVRLSSDKPVALLGVRVNEVTASGESWPVSLGMLNLTHRDSSAEPTALKPGQFYDVTVDLRFVGRRISAGSRIRVALSSSFWPMVATAPESTQLVIESGHASHLTLPVLRNSLPRVTRSSKMTADQPGTDAIEIEESVERGGRLYFAKTTRPTSVTVGPQATVARYWDKRSAELDEKNPAASWWSMNVTQELSWPGIDIDVSATCDLHTDASTYRVVETLTARENGCVAFHRESTVNISRELS